MKNKHLIYGIISLIIIVMNQGMLHAQFPPPAGQPGSTAIARDSSAIISWANDCQVSRGYINMADTLVTINGNNRASYGSYLYASGPSDEYVVSLGDHGSAVLTFDPPITNAQGPDFAVFENSFGDLFLELAFVEVSSDGIHFVRFPAITLVPENNQIPTFGTIEASRIHNFAGKYRMGFGTPFDLSDLKDSAGVNLSRVTHVKIVDAGGCITEPYVTFDSQGHKVNDPWPTPFDTGGFDLDAIGVIHNTVQGICQETNIPVVNTYPNPFSEEITIDPGNCKWLQISLFSMNGNLVANDLTSGLKTIFTNNFNPGIYFLHIVTDRGYEIHRKMIRQ